MDCRFVNLPLFTWYAFQPDHAALFISFALGLASLPRTSLLIHLTCCSLHYGYLFIRRCLSWGFLARVGSESVFFAMPSQSRNQPVRRETSSPPPMSEINLHPSNPHQNSNPMTIISNLRRRAILRPRPLTLQTLTTHECER